MEAAMMPNADTTFGAERMASLIKHMSSTYSEPDFQTYLHALELKMCKSEDKKHLEHEIKKAVKGVLATYGLTRKEFEKLIKHYRAEGGDMERSLNEFELLRCPGLRCMLLDQKDQQATRVRAAAPWLPASERLQSKPAAHGARGPPRDWEVTGGNRAGGVMVRLGESLQSPALSARLASGAVVRELKMVGSRIHYEKISGAGPMYGWVSTAAQKTTLLKLVSPAGQDATLEEAAGGKGGISASIEALTTCASDSAVGSEGSWEAILGSDDDGDGGSRPGDNGDSEGGPEEDLADAARGARQGPGAAVPPAQG